MKMNLVNPPINVEPEEEVDLNVNPEFDEDAEMDLAVNIIQKHASAKRPEGHRNTSVMYPEPICVLPSC